jgi:hypothetical protein
MPDVLRKVITFRHQVNRGSYTADLSVVLAASQAFPSASSVHQVRHHFAIISSTLRIHIASFLPPSPSRSPNP